MAGSSAWRRGLAYLGLVQDETGREVSPHVLQRRIDHLERQVETLARLADIDPRRLPQPEPVCSPQVVALAREGKQIQAIKLHREQTGLGLAEAKWDIDALR